LFLDIAKLKHLQANIIQAEQQLSLIPSLTIGSLLRKMVIVDDVLLMDEELGARYREFFSRSLQIRGKT
jgi:hypothetical protein